MPDLVIGHGPAGVRAAAVLGEHTLLLETDTVPGGVTAPELPEGLGHALAADGAADAVRSAYGAAPTLESRCVERVVLIGGHQVALPISRAALRRVLPQDDAVRILAEQGRIFARAQVRKLVGGGAEERTYRDWVVQRFGEHAYHLLHQPYAARRWGEPEQLNVSLARLHHETDPAAARVALGVSPEVGWQSLVSRAGAREGGLSLEALEVADGRVAAVRTAQGRHQVDGRLIYTGPLSRLVTLLGDAIGDGLRWDLRRLGARHRIQVAVPIDGSGRDLPAELHVVRGDAPFFRVTSPAQLPGCSELASTLIAHISCDEDDGAWQATDDALARQVVAALPGLGLPKGSAAAARVQRLPHHDPAWTGPWHPVMVRVLLGMQSLGIELAGRSGAYQWVDPGQELRHAAALVGGAAADPRELARTLLDPPIPGPRSRVTLAHFVTA